MYNINTGKLVYSLFNGLNHFYTIINNHLFAAENKKSYLVEIKDTGKGIKKEDKMSKKTKNEVRQS